MVPVLSGRSSPHRLPACGSHFLRSPVYEYKETAQKKSWRQPARSRSKRREGVKARGNWGEVLLRLVRPTARGGAGGFGGSRQHEEKKVGLSWGGGFVAGREEGLLDGERWEFSAE